MRQFTLLDTLINEVDHALRTIHGTPATTERPYPAQDIQESQELNDEERKLAGSLMRINHAGEVSAQGLYRGQALTAKTEETRKSMERSAMEENDHLEWCARRLKDHDTHRSYLSPLWYWGSFSMGAAAGLIGDKWSLGFVKETEDQVIKHLEEHLIKLPTHDLPDLVILKQMREDEAHHGDLAVKAGGAKLPLPVRKIVMPLLSKVMTKTAYHV